MSATVLQGGRYCLLHRHGAGGVSDVWVAHDDRLHRSVAIKVLRRSSPEMLARFEREALATAALQHRHIVRVLDYFVEDGVPYLVMELLEGVSLSELVYSTGCLEARRAAMLLLQVASALDFAHARGVIHRDVKPANIQVVPAPHGAEIAKVLDFGIAKLSGKTSVTHDGDVLGTPAFMAPEQAAGAIADPKSDVFAAGVTLYFALAARLPYPGQTPREIHAQVTAGIHEPLSRVRPDLDVGLHQIVERAMRQDPRERFASAAELQGALQAWLSGADRMPAIAATQPPARGRALAIGAFGIVMLGVLAVFGATGVAGVWLYRNDGLFEAPSVEPAAPGAPHNAPIATTSQTSTAGDEPPQSEPSGPITAPVRALPAPDAQAPPAASGDAGDAPPPSPTTSSSAPAPAPAPGKLCQWNPHCLPNAVCCRQGLVHSCPQAYRNRCIPCAMAPGHQMCAGVCTRTAYDSKNCGSCGHVCPAGTTCTAGQCQAPAPLPTP